MNNYISCSFKHIQLNNPWIVLKYDKIILSHLFKKEIIAFINKWDVLLAGANRTQYVGGMRNYVGGMRNCFFFLLSLYGEWSFRKHKCPKDSKAIQLSGDHIQCSPWGSRGSFW